MITNLHIENFKSLADFDLPPNGLQLAKFTCLIGLNGSGKSTLLQAFDFLGQLAIGKMGEWLGQRSWKKSELACNLGKRSPFIKFRMKFQFDKSGDVEWNGRFSTTLLRCTNERIEKNGMVLLDVSEERLTVAKMDQRAVQVIEKPDLVYEGSVLSILQLKDAHSDVSRVKEVLQNLKSLELLSPHLLRKRASSADDIGIGGEKLAPFLDQLTGDSHSQLQDRLREFYPHLEKWIVKGYRFGWKGLRVWEDYNSGSVVDAAHLNDGMLRVIAILAQAYSRHRVLLFDEIENGVNPELVEKLVKWLIDLGGAGGNGKQVIVTTHSPMILNYIPDAIAREAVILIYKPADGRTRCVRFFDLKETQLKLRALGPGEVFVDTKLGDLVAHLPPNQSKP
jgi:predicted ATPase